LRWYVIEVDDEMGSHTSKRGGNNHFSLPDHTPVIFRSLLSLSSFALLKSRMVYLSGASLSRLSWQKGH